MNLFLTLITTLSIVSVVMTDNNKGDAHPDQSDTCPNPSKRLSLPVSKGLVVRSAIHLSQSNAKDEWCPVVEISGSTEQHIIKLNISLTVSTVHLSEPFRGQSFSQEIRMFLKPVINVL